MDERIGFGLHQLCGNSGALDVSLCLSCGGVGHICVEWVGSLDQSLEGWIGVMCV